MCTYRDTPHALPLLRRLHLVQLALLRVQRSPPQPTGISIQCMEIAACCMTCLFAQLGLRGFPSLQQIRLHPDRPRGGSGGGGGLDAPVRRRALRLLRQRQLHHTGDVRRVIRSAGIRRDRVIKSHDAGTIQHIEWLILIDRVQPSFIAGVVGNVS